MGQKRRLVHGASNSTLRRGHEMSKSMNVDAVDPLVGAQSPLKFPGDLPLRIVRHAGADGDIPALRRQMFGNARRVRRNAGHFGPIIDAVYQQGRAAGRSIRIRGAFVRRQGYIAPLAVITAGTVRMMIHRSNQKLRRRMYSRSNSIHSSKPRLLRPEICQRQVNPGFTARRPSW